MRGLFTGFLVFFFSLFFITDVSAQQIRAAVIGGMNLAQVDGDEIYGYNKIGFNTGLGAMAPIGKNFYLNLEILFNQKGSYQGEQYETTDSLGNTLTGEYNLKLDYLEVPLLFLYNDKDIFTAGGGFSYGRLINVSEYEHGRKIESTSLNSGPYERNDFNVIADLRFRIYKKIKLNIRYAYSMAKIRTRTFEDFQGQTWTRDQFNNLISFRIIYMINEKLPAKADSKNENADF